MQRPLLWHIQLKLRSFFFAEHKLSLRRFLIPTTNKWPEWYDEMIFLQVLEKVECHQETAKKDCQSHAGRLDWVGRGGLTQCWRLRGWWWIGILVATVSLGSVCFARAAIITEPKILKLNMNELKNNQELEEILSSPIKVIWFHKCVKNHQPFSLNENKYLTLAQPSNFQQI